MAKKHMRVDVMLSTDVVERLTAIDWGTKALASRMDRLVWVLQSRGALSVQERNWIMEAPN